MNQNTGHIPANMRLRSCHDSSRWFASAAGIYGLIESTGVFPVGLIRVAFLSLGVMGKLRPADAV